MNNKENDNVYRLLISIALVWVLIGVWSEVSRFWETKHNWEKLLSISGKVVISTYLILFVLGLVQLVAGAWNVSLLGRCLLYTSPSPRDRTRSRMPSSA